MRGLYMILDIVQDHFQIQIYLNSRKREFVDARNIYYKLSKEFIDGITFAQIADPVNKTHASVIHGINTLDFLLKYDRSIQQNYLILKNKCLNKLDLANPYEKYLGKEDKLQHEVMTYIKEKYPDVFAIHIPNEGKRSTFERYKFKYLGGVAGVPDIMIFRSNKKSNGLAIELKVGYNKPTENQFKVLDKLKKENWEVHWLKDYEKTTQIIDKYLQ